MDTYLSINNLKDLCRICLCNLTTEGSGTCYNIYLLPRLNQLMMHSTSLNLNEEEAIYPKGLCLCCYNKLIEYEKFQWLALQSTKRLFGIVQNSLKAPTSLGVPAPDWKEQEKEVEKRPTIIPEANYADLLLLPEVVVNYFEKIKPERIDTEKPRLQTPDIFTTHCQQPEQPKNLLAEPKIMQQEIQAVMHDEGNNEAAMCLVRNEMDSNYDELEVDVTKIDIATPRLQTPGIFTTHYQQLEQSDNEMDSNYDELEVDITNIDFPSDDIDVGDNEHMCSANSFVNVQTAEHGSGEAAIPKSSKGYTTKSIKCPQCNKRASKPVHLDAHIRGVHEGHKKPYFCPECDRKFSRFNKLHHHMKLVHKKQHHQASKFQKYPFKGCLENGENVRAPVSDANSAGLLAAYQAVNTGGYDLVSRGHFVCPQCSRDFNKKQEFRVHLKRHLQIKDHVCNVCGIAKVTSNELRLHKKRHKDAISEGVQLEATRHMHTVPERSSQGYHPVGFKI